MADTHGHSRAVADSVRTYVRHVSYRGWTHTDDLRTSLNMSYCRPYGPSGYTSAWLIRDGVPRRASSIKTNYILSLRKNDVCRIWLLSMYALLLGSHADLPLLRTYVNLVLGPSQYSLSDNQPFRETLTRRTNR